MKTYLLMIMLMLLLAGSVVAQDATPDAPMAVVTGADVTTVYIEVLPVWVLPAFALLLGLVGFLIFVIYKQGGKLAEMVSEKGMIGLVKIAVDFAGSIAEKTPNKFDDAFIGLVRGEALKEPNAPVASPPAAG